MLSAVDMGQSNPADSGSTSTSLVRRLRDHDAAAWERMVDLFTPLLYHWCRQSSLAPEEAADVTQDVFRTVVHSIGSFKRDAETGTFRGWLRTICRSRVVDYIRQTKAEPNARGGSDALVWLENQPDDEIAEADPATQALFHRVLALVKGEFNPPVWQAFWLVTVDEQPAKDVAGELGMTAAAVRQAKYRVLRRVREEMGDVE
jgi:RNA polymerase sigma-70 factor (ECF subfamily)